MYSTTPAVLTHGFVTIGTPKLKYSYLTVLSSRGVTVPDLNPWDKQLFASLPMPDWSGWNSYSGGTSSGVPRADYAEPVNT